MIAGFKRTNEEKQSEGAYAPLVGQYVRFWLPNGNALGKVIHADHRTIGLLPHLIFSKHEFTQGAYVEREIPSIVSVESVQCTQPIRDGEMVLERIVAEIEEQNKVNLHKRQKELKDIGYIPEK